MTCPSETRALAFVEGEATAEERARLTAHLDECADCRMLFAALLGQSQLNSATAIAPDMPPSMGISAPTPPNSPEQSAPPEGSIKGKPSRRWLRWIYAPLLALIPVSAAFVGIEMRTFFASWKTSDAPVEPVTLDCRSPLGRIRGGTYIAGPRGPAVSGAADCEVTLDGATIRATGISPAIAAGGKSRIHLVNCRVVGAIELVGEGRVDVVE